MPMTHEELAERALSKVFRDLADTRGVEIRVKRDNGAEVSQIEASTVRACLRKFENEMVPDGVVHVFDIIRYPKPSRAYT